MKLTRTAYAVIIGVLFFVIGVAVGQTAPERVTVENYLAFEASAREWYMFGFLYGLEAGYLNPDRARTAWQCTTALTWTWNAVVRFVDAYLRTHPELRGERIGPAVIVSLSSVCR